MQIVTSAIVIMLAACGRIGFAPHAASDAPAGDTADPSLVAYYPFDNDPAGRVIDRTANHLDGRCATANACPTVVQGHLGTAVLFDGIDDRFAVPDPGALQLHTGFTVALWVSATSVTDTTVMSKPLAVGPGASFELLSVTTALSFVSTDGMTETFLGGPALVVGAWTHIAMTWDGTTRRLFENRVEVASDARSCAFDATPLQLGCDQEDGTPNAFFDGAIDEVRIYDRPLSAAELAALP